MKAILINILAFLLIGSLYSQTDNDFQDLIKIFNQGKDTEIPNYLAQKYFDFIPTTDPDFGNKTLYVKEIVLQNNQIIGLSAYSDCGAGGICQHTDLIILTENGKLVDKVIGFELIAADCSFENIKYCTYYSDTLLIIVNQHTEGDCIEDTLFSNKTIIEYLHISTDGIISHGLTQIIDTRRRYYTLSIEMLNYEDLVGISKQDLAVMRNEIFAAHGYKFNSDKWTNYFGSKDWYEPRFEMVDNQLTEIEKKNIELILKQENK